MTVAGLVLAAGAGSRLGTPKALVHYRQGTLLDNAVTVLRDGGCEPVYAVLGARATEAEAAAACAFTTIVNPQWSHGMGSSLRAGLSALASSHEAVIVMLVDQPGIGTACVRRVRRAHAAGAPVAMACYSGRRGHPVCFDRTLWKDVAASAHGDVGAREFLRENPRLITEVDCTRLGDPRDVDTADDLRQWRAAHPRRR